MGINNLFSLGGKSGRRDKTVQMLFDQDWYLRHYPDALSHGSTPLDHYLTIGEAKGFKPNKFFDPDYYLKKAPGAQKYDGTALEHYALKGWRRDRNPSKEFSGTLYLEMYPSVAELDMPPLSYHLNTGRYEGKIAFPVPFQQKKLRHLADKMRIISESGLFDGDWYRSYYTDVRAAGLDPLHHYVRFGSKEQRHPNQFFQPEWYQAAYGTKASEDFPLLHYIQKGIAGQHNPGSGFCTKSYREKNAEHLAPGDDPLRHYIHEGMANRLPKPGVKKAKPLEGPKKDKNSQLPVPDVLRNVLNFVERPLAPVSNSFSPDQMHIHWVVPAFAPGGGGHMTIFRMVHYLEVAGHKQTLWINNPNPEDTVDSIYQMLENHFQHFTGEIRFVDDTLADAQGDAIIATDCWTVYPVLAANKFVRRFYFVQDFEPSFHPMGAHYLLAEQTYQKDLDCLCASPWLADRMSTRYGRWARHFWLAADQRIYHPTKKRAKNKKPRIAVYARHFTARRAVELAFLSLEKLAADGVQFAVDFFGAPLELKAAPFDFVDHGVASQEELARIFQNADIGLVFSATNYSLVPQEMMACGLPIVELDVESTQAIFPENVVTLAQPDPVAVANTVKTLLNDKEALKAQSKAALSWVSTFAWRDSAAIIEEALKERLSEFAKPVESQSAETEVKDAIKVSVVIPTLNAGKVFEDVLSAVVNQQTPWPIEILVVDSGSTDDTLEIVAKHSTVRLHQIDKKDFNHGATRNLGVELTSGEFIAFLTHDAMPVNDRWLYNMVTSIERFPDAAGAFGKHYAWPEATPFTKRDLKRHFESFSKMPIAVSKSTNPKRWKDKKEGWLQALHFYSDNNSCFRRSVWEKIPYRTVAFGEDQLWAWDIINAGFEKVYAPQAAVYHSHDYDEAETFERSRIESAFFKHFFGYELMKDEETLEETLESINRADQHWAEAHDVEPGVTKERLKLNEARLRGYLAGVAEADTEKF